MTTSRVRLIMEVREARALMAGKRQSADSLGFTMWLWGDGDPPQPIKGPDALAVVEADFSEVRMSVVVGPGGGLVFISAGGLATPCNPRIVRVLEAA